jgi:hypothetical protein
MWHALGKKVNVDRVFGGQSSRKDTTRKTYMKMGE